MATTCNERLDRRPTADGRDADFDMVTRTKSVAQDILVLPSGAADMRDVLGFMPAFAGDSNEVDARAFVDQQPHDTAMASSLRRPRRTGCRSRHGSLRFGPRSG